MGERSRSISSTCTALDYVAVSIIFSPGRRVVAPASDLIFICGGWCDVTTLILASGGKLILRN